MSALAFAAGAGPARAGASRAAVARVAHELRTPLTSLRAVLQLLEAGEQGEHGAQGPWAGDDVAEMLTIARRNAELMAELVDDLLDMERLEVGALLLQRRPAAVREVLHAAVDSVRGTAAARGVELVVEAPDAVVWGDERRLVQVMRNLASNAVRHCDEGDVVTLQASATDGSVELLTHDSGCGIPPESVPYVFEPYWQAPAAAPGGSGLGLSLVRSIVTAHGGLVSLDSEPGVGTRVQVVLPQRAHQVRVPFDRRTAAG